MSAIGEANPYEFTADIEDATVRTSDTESVRAIATGPLSFGDYRHAIRLGAGRMLIIVGCSVSLLLGYLAFHATRQELMQMGAGAVVLVLYVLFAIPFSRRRNRRLFEKMQPVRRWVITDKGFHQENYDGESVFVPYSSVFHATCSHRVARIIVQTGTQSIVPRAGFTEDAEWQRFVRNLRHAGNMDQLEDLNAAELPEDRSYTERVVVTGPMNDAEAAALLHAIRYQSGFLKRHQVLLFAIPVVSSGAAMLLLTEQKLTTDHVLALAPLHAVVLLFLVGGWIVRRVERKALREEA